MRIRVMSYNIHRAVGRDGRRDAARIVRVMRQADADIIALQEVETLIGRGHEHDLFNYLGTEMGYFAAAGPTLYNPYATYGNALLSRFPLSMVQRHDISVGGREPRGVVEAEIDCRGRALQVVVTHLGLLGYERRRQIRALTAMVKASALPFVVCGDFNEWLPANANLRRLDNAWGGSFARRSFPSHRPVLALDRLSSGRGAEVREFNAFRTAASRLASDHLPLLCEVELTA